MKKLILALSVMATPAFAASKPFFSLKNTDFVVLICFVLFMALMVYLKVPRLLGGLLDKRAEGIKSELDEAKQLHEDAQSLLASYERKQKEVLEQADRIVAAAKVEANKAATEAKAELEKSMARRLAAADDQIASAQAAAVKEVRDSAITVAVAVANTVIAAKLSAAESNALIDNAIKDVDAKLH